jgi:hypothetical protein
MVSIFSDSNFSVLSEYLLKGVLLFWTTHFFWNKKFLVSQLYFVWHLLVEM